MVPPPASLPGALNRPSLCAAPLPTSWSILLPPRLKVAPGRWWWQAVGRYRQEEPWQPSERGPALPPAVIMVGLLGLLLFPLLQANRGKASRLSNTPSPTAPPPAGLALPLSRIAALPSPPQPPVPGKGVISGDCEGDLPLGPQQSLPGVRSSLGHLDPKPWVSRCG